jgi:hypothetical protein
MDINNKAAAGSAVGARTVVAHVLAVAATVLVLVWCVHFRHSAAVSHSGTGSPGQAAHLQRPPRAHAPGRHRPRRGGHPLLPVAYLGF